jgi:hypothetical protein
MNDDYLWDKTGQPDPQIQQLEEILGTLSYQPRPLEIPKDLVAPRRPRYFPLLAIAASVLLAILAAGVWLRVRSRSESPKQQARIETTTPGPEEKPHQTPTSPENKSAVNPPLVAANKSHRKRSAASVFPKREREEALMAKEQVMLALRLASEKLSLVHRKTQSTTPANQIKNQHRTG